MQSTESVVGPGASGDEPLSGALLRLWLLESAHSRRIGQACVLLVVVLISVCGAGSAVSMRSTCGQGFPPTTSHPFCRCASEGLSGSSCTSKAREVLCLGFSQAWSISMCQEGATHK